MIAESETVIAESPEWAVSIAGRASSPVLRLDIPERALAASVIAQAYFDALEIGELTTDVRGDACAFFRDWRLEAYCSIIGLDPGAVRERFETTLQAVKRGVLVASRSKGTGMLVLDELRRTA